MPRTPISEQTVGAVFVDEDGVLWQQIMFCAEPTASFIKIGAPEVKKSGAVGSRILSGLTVMVPEGEG